MIELATTFYTVINFVFSKCQTTELYIFKKSKVELAYHVIINIEKEKNIYENEKYFAQ